MKFNFVQGSVTRKIFIITTLLLIISAFMIYLLLYFLLPQFYYKYKQDNLNDNVTMLVDQIEGKSFATVERILDKFTTKTKNVSLIVSDLEGNIVYLPSVYIPNNEKTKAVKSVPVLPVQPAKSNAEKNEEENKINEQEVPSTYSVNKEIQLQEGKYHITFYSYLYPIDEITRVLSLFMPYVLAIIIVISIAGAIIYSKLLAKPLIKLNTVAKKMAKLDFSQKSTIDSKDELGELSTNLNNLSDNLQQTMIQLNNANDKLKDDIEKERELDAKRRQFLIAISHDLKTPITIIKGQLEGMLLNIGVFKNRDRYLQKSYETMNGMEALVIEILELSKLESEVLQLNKKNVNLTDLMQSILEELDYFSYAKQLKVVKSLEEDIYFSADQPLVKKGLSTIIHNAYSYTQEGKEVFISLQRQNSGSVLEVLNTGAHIHNDNLEHIFEPFYRIEKSRNRHTGGHGLGLFIAQQIFDAHKLQYSIQNTDDGVKFIIRF
ncbi:sensor histidine kinase [Lysinibacillus cavernae]|uniref:sensor histidine kinase n=1 Tax=Lysinibacillus cavernae TaxID=2666135 RepID=UPI0012D8DB71|nr:HAMP domain-containing sensor histidine kinase [Lysinibacillus cavernae]